MLSSEDEDNVVAVAVDESNGEEEMDEMEDVEEDGTEVMAVAENEEDDFDGDGEISDEDEGGDDVAKEACVAVENEDDEDDEDDDDDNVNHQTNIVNQDESDDSDDEPIRKRIKKESKRDDEAANMKKKKRKKKKKKRKKKGSSDRKDRKGDNIPSVKNLGIPFRAIKRTMKIDPDIATVQNEAAMVATYAVELFVKKMVKQSYDSAKKRGRNTVRYEDLAEVRANNSNLDFLDTILP
mmetsp:Transcript_21785/g.25941  ORF Transcript_21785/g.25941 Transcript_21785/m.25941 type:complete len:238 (+) Transcript_21785:143-856(+)